MSQAKSLNTTNPSRRGHALAAARASMDGRITPQGMGTESRNEAPSLRTIRGCPEDQNAPKRTHTDFLSNDPAGQRTSLALSSSIALSTHVPYVVARSPPQARGCDIRTLSTGLKLRPHDVLGDPFPPCECTKAAIGTGNDALPVADRRHRGFNALRHDLGVLNQVDLRVDDPWQQDHVIRQFVPTQRGNLVLATCIGKLDAESAHVGLKKHW